MAANSICLSPAGQYIRKEGKAGAAGILPGHLLVETATGVTVNGTADAVALQALFADINIGDAGDITRAYTDGENVHYVAATKGTLITARVGNLTLAIGDQVAAAADGTVKAPAAAGVGVIGYVKETVTSGTGAESGAGFVKIQIL